MKRTDQRSRCPINFGLEVFGDSWSLLIVRDMMFKGKHTYAEFAVSEEQISTSVLATRLRTLVKAGLVDRSGSGGRTRYALTQRGLDLLPMMVEMILWSARHDPQTAAVPDFVERARTDREALLAEIGAAARREHGIGSAEEG